MSGVSACRNNINACSIADQEIQRQASRARQRKEGKALPNHVTPNGRSMRQELKARRGSGSNEAAMKMLEDKFGWFLGKETAAVAAKKILHRLGLERVAAGTAGVSAVLTAHSIHDMLKSTISHDVNAIRNASWRDGMQLLILASIRDEVPGYADAMIKTRKDSMPALYAIHTRLVVEKKLAPLQKQLRQSAREGKVQAKAFGLKSVEELKAQLAMNKSFKQRYDADSAFRHGVHYAVFKAIQAAEAKKAS